MEKIEIWEDGNYTFVISYMGKQVSIRPGDLGYSLLRAKLPAIKSAHGIACKRGECGIPVEDLINRP